MLKKSNSCNKTLVEVGNCELMKSAFKGFIIKDSGMWIIKVKQGHIMREGKLKVLFKKL